jgi:hypothetical protein
VSVDPPFHAIVSQRSVETAARTVVAGRRMPVVHRFAAAVSDTIVGVRSSYRQSCTARLPLLDMARDNSLKQYAVDMLL